MAPTITAVTTSSQEHLTLSHKLRKPLVEKFRRERINSCIEQLKSLLGPEFLQQHPDSKLEKADILEMTVGVLRRLQHRRALDSVLAARGYSRCVQEVERFLSREPEKTRLMKTFNQLKSSSGKKLTESDFSHPSSTVSKDKRPVGGVLWRPWSTSVDE
ncbi:transcription factor HES-5-like [Antennarius striatus]|uniref:transcription factor HES-5-like n=1 Tax=Antennarius striatus TaxID=241820 RepID=UPI0035B0F67E